MNRCEWANSEQIYMDYHDNEWGIPLHDDRKLFEFLNLEGQQAGLSWITILKKREGYRKAFDNFDPNIVKDYDDAKIEELMNNKDIVRNRLKINAVIANSKAYFKLIAEYKSLDNFLWSHIDFVPIINDHKDMGSVLAETPLSKEISMKLKKIGFKFIGPTIIYAYMQAIGMVDDHLLNCYKREKNTK